MNVYKRGKFVPGTNKIIRVGEIITKGWRKIYGYKTRGYRNRLDRVGRARMIKGYPTLTYGIKRNRVHRITLKPTNLNEAE